MSLMGRKTKSIWTYADLDKAAMVLGITFDTTAWSHDQREARLFNKGELAATAFSSGDLVSATGSSINRDDLKDMEIITPLVKEADPELERLLREEDEIEKTKAAMAAAALDADDADDADDSVVIPVLRSAVHSPQYSDPVLLRTLVRHLTLYGQVSDNSTELVDLLDEIMGY